jgi:tetratricopeptide (TPR) repeat protein
MGENGSSDSFDQSLATAIQAAKSSKDSEEAWDDLEKLADSLQRQEEVAAVYVETLSPKLPKNLFDRLSKRALRFHEDWFGDDPKAMSNIVTRIIEIDPKALWAFERLTVALTALEKWEELLAVHDRLIDLTQESSKKKQLLDEAAHVAKDFAGDLDRAADYMIKLLAIDPDNGQLSSSVERLLERLERWVELIDVWRKRMASAGREQARALRLQTVRCCLDHLKDPAQALGELLSLFGENPGDEEACRELERVLVYEHAPQEIRLASLNCLRDNYDAEKNPEAVVKAIEMAIDFMPSAEKLSLHREAGARLSAMHRDVEASGHFAGLLLEQPSDQEARDELRRLAARSKLHGKYAEALIAAAESCDEKSTKVGLLVEAAELFWDHLDDRETAVELYFRVLNTEDVDRSNALRVAHSLNELLRETGRDEERLSLLELLSNLERATAVKNAIAGEAARLADALGKPDKALSFWKIRLDQDGGDMEALSATADLLDRNERWEELISVLKQRAAASQTREQRRADLARVAEIQANKNNSPDEAIRTWSELVDEFGARKDALDSLNVLMEAADRWDDLAEVLETVAGDEYKRAAEMADRLGDIHLTKLGDENKALRFYGRALALDPTDKPARAALIDLLDSQATGQKAVESLAGAYRATDDWERAIEILEQRLNNAGETADKIRILIESAKMQEHRANDLEAAFETLTRALRLDPFNTAIQKDLTRLAEATANWPDAASALLEAAKATPDNPSRCADLFCSAGGILEQKMGDSAAAEEALSRAVEIDPNHRKALDLLASIQRSKPGPKLVQTLMRISASEPENLELLFEAAKAAVETLEDYPAKRSVLEKLLKESSRALTHLQRSDDASGVLEKAAFAIEEMIEIDLKAKRPESAALTLVESADLPFDAATVQAMRIRAADIYLDTGRRARSIDLYANVLEETPEDLDTMRKLESVLRRENRVYDLIILLRREVKLTEDAETRLNLRLEIARLVGLVEGRDERVQSLCANLEEEPGHPGSIEAILGILHEKSKYPAIADLLTEQAKKLEGLGKASEAAHIWSIIADVSEQFLRDPERAVFAYARVVEMDCTLKALDALARICLERDTPSEAVTWLRRRLMDTEDPAERVAVMLKLAKAQIQASQRNRAITTLESAIKETPDNIEVRKLLISQYRLSEKWDALAEALSKATEHVTDEASILAYAREAAEIYNQRLGSPGGAVPVLERALPLAPEDRLLKSMLVDGFVVSGRLEEAHKLALGLIDDFGRRRSGERAAAHLLLARIANAEGNIGEALEQLEHASKMDSQNAVIWQTMAELAREAGQLDKAERALRTLLLIIRRNPSAASDSEQMGAAEIFMDLYRIASDQDRADQARELLESAFETLSKNDIEAPRLKAKLLKWGRNDLLDRFFEIRLAEIEKPRIRAEILSEYAALLDDPLERPADALDAWLKAVDADPGSPAIHQAAYKSAHQNAKVELYVEKLKDLLEGLRRESDAHVRCELLLNLSKAMESDIDDIDSAFEYYKQAEAIGVCEVDVWRIGARLAARRGDTSEQMRLLKNLASLGEEGEETEARTDALYRLAEIQLASEETWNEGFESMNRALAEDPKYARAGRILGRACEALKPNEDLLALYERIARESDDDRMLLDYLGLKAAQIDTTPEQIREGCELARKLGETDRLESLMIRAVEIGKDLLEGMSRIDWALTGLAELNRQKGRVRKALEWLIEAAESANPENVASMASDLAELSAGVEDVSPLFLKLYERIFERDSTIRSAWEPLADMYAESRDLDHLERLVNEVVASLSEPSDRNALRLKQGELFLKAPGREKDAVEVLKDILLEEPGHAEAMALLAGYWEQSGNTDDLIDLFRHQFTIALETGEASAIKNTALKLGRYLQPHDPDQAKEVFQRGLDFTPEDRSLLQGLLDSMDPSSGAAERAEIMERILAHEDEAKAAPLAIEIASLYESVDDGDGALRTLLTGFRLAPSNESICELLKGMYRERGDGADLAQILVQASRHRNDSETRVSMLQEAALIYRDELSDLEKAVTTLREMIEINPNRAALRVDLTSVLTAAGEYGEAIDQITEVIGGIQEEEDLVDLLGMRAQILAASGDHAGAVKDLERAYELNPSKIAPDLEAALLHRLKEAVESYNSEAERATTLRLAEIMLGQGRSAEALRVLVAWTEKDTRDTEVLHLILDIHTSEGRWDGVGETCAALIQIESGDAQAQTAKRLANAYKQLKTPESALPWLSLAHENQPPNRVIVNELIEIYEHIGADRNLAEILLETAKRADDKSERAALLRRAGMLFLNIGDKENAADALQEARNLSPDDPEIIVSLFDVFLMSGKNAEASALLDEAIEASKGQRSQGLGLLQQRKAKLARQQGDHLEELDWLKQSVLTDRANGETALDLADRAEELGEWDIAVWALKTIALMKTGSPISRAQVFLRQANISLKRGDQRRAALFARQAEQEEPDSEEIKSFLKGLEPV